MTTNPLKSKFDDNCPTCGWNIPDDVREGDECLECGYVFMMDAEPEPSEDTE